MIKDFMTAYWGYLPTTLKPYPASEKVNAFVGPSGHGKTTIWDGLRVVLGDTTFESKRKVENYVHPKSNWAIVRVAFNNLPKEGIRPFERHGYYEDEVVICCRVFKNNDGRWSKEYYVFDGEFTNILDLAGNHKSYKQKLKLQGEYNKILEDCLGITPAFKKLMATNPETVRDMVKYNPNELFKKIFDLKGIKEVQDRYRSAKENLASLEIECESAEKNLTEARAKFEDYKDKVKKYDEYKQNEKQLNVLSLRMKKLEYFEKTNEVKNYTNEIFEKNQAIERENSNLIQLKLRCKELNLEIQDISKQIQDCKAQHRLYNEKVEVDLPKFTELKNAVEALKKKIEELSSLEGKDINEITDKLKQVCEERKVAEFNLMDAENKLKKCRNRQSQLDLDKPLYPDYVSRFLNQLKQKEIEHLMIADAVSIKSEFRKWQKAVEAYLGSNRFRIIVNQQQYVKTKKLQESFRYTSRVCLPKSYGISKPKKPENLLSIYDVIEISYPDKIGGYLKELSEIFLVDTVEEGDMLQKKGLVSITREGLLQDHDGAIFRNYHNLCCGKLAIKVESEQVKEDIAKFIKEDEVLKVNTQKLIENEKSLEAEVTKLKEFEKLPELRVQYDELKQLANKTEADLEDMKTKREEALDKQDKLHEINVKKNNELTQCRGDIKVQEDRIQGYIHSIQETDQNISSAESDIRQIKADLINKGLQEEEFPFIEEDVKTSAYLDASGEIIKSSVIRIQCSTLTNAIMDFKRNYPDINEKIITLYNAQNRRVEEMVENLKELRARRDDWNAECITSLEDLRQHIRITVKEYIEEFQTLAGLLKASARGRIEERGEDPEYWELYLYIGYDGKEATLIDGPELSSGQKACTSLMLLLAAINDRKENKRVPIMFLDEPKSRLDDSRGNEVGALLQLTDIQYFITHQQGESLKYIDWINHCFSVSVCKPGEEFAPPLLFQRMRSA